MIDLSPLNNPIRYAELQKEATEKFRKALNLYSSEFKSMTTAKLLDLMIKMPKYNRDMVRAYILHGNSNGKRDEKSGDPPREITIENISQISQAFPKRLYLVWEISVTSRNDSSAVSRRSYPVFCFADTDDEVVSAIREDIITHNKRRNVMIDSEEFENYRATFSYHVDNIPGTGNYILADYLIAGYFEI